MTLRWQPITVTNFFKTKWLNIDLLFAKLSNNKASLNNGIHSAITEFRHKIFLKTAIMPFQSSFIY